MKAHFKPIALMAILMAVLFASCHSPQYIEGDFDMNNLKTGIDTFRKHHPIIHNGDVVTIHLNNANKDLYTVKLSRSVVSYNTTVPSQLSLSSIVLPGPAEEMTGASNMQQSCAQLIGSAKMELSNEIMAFEAADNNINKVIAFNYFLLSLQKDCGLSSRQVQDNAAIALQNISVSQIAALAPFIDQNIQDAESNYFQITQTLKTIDAYFNCDSCKNSIKKQHTQNFTESEKGELSTIKDDYGKILTFEQSGQKYTIIQNYKAITNPANYTFSAVDTARNADEVNFNINISPKNWLPCRAVDTSFNINLKVARFKIDFSTGVFLNWGGAAFSGKNYFIDSTGTVKQIAKNSNNYIPSIGALAHFYYRSTHAIDPGLVLGASLSTNVQYTNFHAGLSCMFNAHNEIFNRVALSAGLTYRYVEDLNSAYSVGSIVEKSLTIDQIETGKFIRGGFIALTYNLSRN